MEPGRPERAENYGESLSKFLAGLEVQSIDKPTANSAETVAARKLYYTLLRTLSLIVCNTFIMADQIIE